MAALNASATRSTGADVDVELPVECLANDFRLELLFDVCFVNRAAAVWAGIGQRSFVDFVYLVGRRRLAMCLRSIVFPRLAPGFFGSGFGGPFEKGAA